MTDNQSQLPLAEAETPVEAPVTQIIRSAPVQDLMLTAAFDVETAKKRLKELQEFVAMYMHEGEDFGTIPGTPKPTLYKPGADKLCDIYAIADRYRVTSRTEDWDKSLFDYEIECTLVSKRTGQLVATGLGSCNSFEGKYRWRDQQRKCPKCEKETIIKGKEEYGGGWLCWKKKGGCGAQFDDEDTAITGQAVGKIQNDDIATLKNTILKMAKKRAKVDAVLSATRSSGLFTQDIEDWSMAPDENQGSKQEADLVAKKKIRESAKGADKNEPITLIPYKEGNYAVAGNSLALLKADVSEDERKKFQMNWSGADKVWILRGADANMFASIAEKHKYKVVWKD